MPDYLPVKGDIITLSFDPQSGHEQRGRRPALVVSNDLFNRHTGLCMACPITNTDRANPFHVSCWAESGVAPTMQAVAHRIERGFMVGW